MNYGNHYVQCLSLSSSWPVRVGLASSLGLALGSFISRQDEYLEAPLLPISLFIPRNTN